MRPLRKSFVTNVTRKRNAYHSNASKPAVKVPCNTGPNTTPLAL